MKIGGIDISEFDKALSAAGLISSQAIFYKEKFAAEDRHGKSVNVDKEQHKKSLNISKQTYLMAAFNDLEKHFQQLNADLINNARESESDMFDQRNQTFQTIILSSSVMFSSLATVIIQGYLPTNADYGLYMSYAVTCSLSFLLLFLSMVLCIEVVLRASRFMYFRAEMHSRQLKDSVSKTKEMLRGIRINAANGAGAEPANGTDPVNSGKGPLNSSFKNSYKMSHRDYYSGKESITSMRSNKEHKAVAKMTKDELDKAWEEHEGKMQKYLESREQIHLDAFSGVVGLENFEVFYQKHCRVLGDAAIVTFYLGTVFLMWAIIIYMWGEFDITYHSLAGAVIAALLIGSASIIGLAVVVILRALDSKSRRNGDRETIEENMRRKVAAPSSDSRDYDRTGTNRKGDLKGPFSPMSPLMSRSRSGSVGSQQYAQSTGVDRGSERRSVMSRSRGDGSVSSATSGDRSSNHTNNNNKYGKRRSQSTGALFLIPRKLGGHGKDRRRDDMFHSHTQFTHQSLEVDSQLGGSVSSESKTASVTTYGDRWRRR